MKPFENIKRRKRGQALTELAANLIWMVPLLLALFDLAVIFLCANANDTAVRDAARAAAQGRPAEFRGEPADSSQRAKAVLQRSIKMGGFITVPEGGFEFEYKGGQPDPTTGGAWPGSVVVRQNILINLPVQVPMLADAPIPMTSMSSFPVTRIEPPDPSINNPL